MAPHERCTTARGYPGQVRSAITGFVQDEEGHWVALLACGHRQHLRHDPPLTNRPLVLTEDGRTRLLGVELDCRACDQPAANEGDASPEP